jgi:methylase of polypeptide subunit release factors
VFDGPLHITDPSAIATLKQVLDRQGFTGDGIVRALGAPLPPGKSHQRDDLPLYLRRLDAPTPLNTLVKLFVLDRSVDESRAAAAFAPLDLEALREIGLVENGPRGLRARLRLSVHEGLVLAHDAYDDHQQALRPDHVLDVNPTTIALSHLTVRRPVSRALEIGTGCGVLALKAARHATHVVATDTNPRALNLAAFNAAINGVTNVEWRLGSLFEPVAGERFDLLFANPPYVISPDSQFIFRDGGRRGHALCEEVVRRAPAFLADGGFASFLINWAIGRDEEWSAALRGWVEANGCDSWLLMSALEEPLTYAALWNRSRDRDTYGAALDRWGRYFEELGVRAIGMGGIVLRRRASGQAWLRADHLPASITSPSGHHVERLFAAEDRLAALSDDAALLARPFTAVDDHRVRQVLRIEDGRYSVEGAEVFLHGGLPMTGRVDALAIQLLGRCHGERPLGAIAEDLAREAGVEPAAFVPAAAAIARRLIASGFLV